MDPSPASNNSENERRERMRIAGMPLSAVAFLVLSATIAVIRSHYQVLWGDEFGFGLLGFDSASSIGGLIHMELAKPLSFDPIGYNALMYAVIHLFGTSAFALRLPTIGGYLLMQVCLFYFVRRIANERAAAVALAIPALVGIVSYSVVSRPYGLLLGLSALVMLCWQTAARRNSRRIAVLAVLSLSLVMVVNTQYYGILLFVPLCVAELVRTLDRRRMDVPVLLSILAGMVGIPIAVPFARALSPFRGHHVSAAHIDFHFITHSYIWLIVGYATLSVSVQHLIGSAIVLLLLALVANFIYFRSRLRLRFPRAELVFLSILAGFPILAELLSTFVTHFVEARYVQPAIIGLGALVAISMMPILQNRVIGRVVLAILFFAIAGTGLRHIQLERENSERLMASLILSPQTRRHLADYPGQPIYAVNHSVFEFIKYYSPNADIRSRMGLVYPRPDDFTGVGEDVFAQMDNMPADGIANVVPYREASKPGAAHLFVLAYQDDWSTRELVKSNAQSTNLGKIFGSNLAYVRFP